MDFATVIGLVFMFLVVLFGMTYDPTTHGLTFDTIGLFVDIPALFIIVFGSFLSTMAAYPIAVTQNILGTLKKLFFPPVLPMVQNLSLLVDLSKIARKNILSLEDSLPDIDSLLLRSGLRMVIDRMNRDAIAEMLQAEVKYRDIEAENEVGFFKMLSTIVPSFGLVGTLLGLIVLLQNLEDPSKIGPALSIAFVATFYGVFFSNAVYYPIFTKLQVLRVQQKIFNEMIRDGVLLVERGERAELVEQVLLNYLTPNQKDLYERLRFGGYAENAA